MKKLSKYIVITDSYDMDSKLLFNRVNGYFIKYSKKDYETLSKFLENEKISKFLEEKGFFDNPDLSYLDNLYKEKIDSADTLNLIIKTTKQCNFRCSYCYENFSNQMIDKSKEKILYNFIRNEIIIKKIKKLYISWFGGEPLLNVDIINSLGEEILKLCKELNVEYHSSITTNGYLLNEKNIDTLFNINNRVFQITLDGWSKIHNKNRVSFKGNATFEKILSNLKKLKLRNEKFIVFIRTNLNNENFYNIEKYYDEISDIFKDRRFIQIFTPVTDFKNMTSEIDRNQIFEVIKKGLSFGINFINLLDDLILYKNLCYACKKNNYVIEPDLSVSKCTISTDEESIVGYIDNESKLILNKNINLWKDSYYSEKCNVCGEKYECRGGNCPKYYLLKKEPRCEIINSQTMQEILKIEDLQNNYNVYIHQ